MLENVLAPIAIVILMLILMVMTFVAGGYNLILKFTGKSKKQLWPAYNIVTISRTIPENKWGEIEISEGPRRTKLIARTENGRSLPAGTIVEIINQTDNTCVVRPYFKKGQRVFKVAASKD